MVMQAGAPPKLLIVLREEGGGGPRGRRATELAERLGEDWVTERVPPPGGDGPSAGEGGACRPMVRRIRRTARAVHARALIDRYELWSRRRFAGWTPSADLALLLVGPYSPAVAAAGRLSRLGIPYVVDAGDPFALAPAPGFECQLRGLARRRALSAERRLWTGAAAAVVTSASMARMLETTFPHLRVLVRPNGFDVAVAPTPERVRVDPRRLRLAHFGTLYAARIDVRPFLARLAASGMWEEVAFDQYGDVWGVDIRAVGVRTRILRELPWNDAVAAAGAYNAAVVVGNRSGLGPPSKVFAYMTLPLPRIAVVSNAARDETAANVDGRAGWLVVEDEDPAAPELLVQHVLRPWRAEELAPSESESWPVVAAEISAFLGEVVSQRHSARAIDPGRDAVVHGR
jgi:glycosyltransferase involved in cell wall biosynthesis